MYSHVKCPDRNCLLIVVQFKYFYILLIFSQLIEVATVLRVTPPPFGTHDSGLFRRYTVRNGSVGSTQKSCYMVRLVRRLQILLLKGAILIKKHNNRDI